ncbi:MAG: nucleotide exchange factor GrpE [Bacteroidales bacterium]|nr:nucleotide exchange factor GrpE [Bacteroidales bacterium]
MSENKDINMEVKEEANKQASNENVETTEAVNNEQEAQEQENSDGGAGEQKEMTEMELMEQKVEAAEQKAAEATDKYVRMAAEFDNFRRRTAKERIELISTAGEDVIKGLLPILDDCERALQVLKNSTDSVAAIEGTELIYNKMMNFLKGRGLAVIEAKDKELDTEFHEAVAQFPVQDKEKKNKIIDIVQQGYTLNGKVIRYAKVVVGM